MPSEVDRIVARYERRKHSPAAKNTYVISHDRYKARFDRYLKFIDALGKHNLLPIEDKKIIEIGAGYGDHLLFFHNLGIPWAQIYGNELLEDVFAELQQRLSPECELTPGNALDLPYEDEFDIVLQSTVFSSILDPTMRQDLASHLLTMLKDDGILLWYDFVRNNPRNKDVQRVSKEEVRTLFAGASSIEFESSTLAPPIARRVGKFYGVLNAMLPFLRTHVVATIRK